MKSGKSLTELASEIERQQTSKRDFISDTRQLRAETNGAFKLSIPQTGLDEDQGFVNSTNELVPVTPIARRQITDRVGIPTKYSDRMAEEAPELLATNINHWFANKPERRMIRTLDGNVRAFLSDRYQRIDNFDVASMVLPVLNEVPGLKVISTEITERKMYIKAVTDRVAGEVKVGDEVQAGVCISNSEIGFGAVVVEPLVFRLVCLNGMVVNDHKFRRHHVGSRADAREGFYELLSDEALRADDDAILLKARDVVRGAMDEVIFNSTLDKMRAAAENRLEGHPEKAVEVLSNKMGFTQEEQGGVLRHLIEGGDLSQWGVLNAVTRYAQDVESYDRATELEALGGTILELPRANWREIAQAA